MTSAGEAAGGVKKEINWCARCYHAIIPSRRGWHHFSDDDWAGPFCECPCAINLIPCLPPSRRGFRELPRYAAGGLVPQPVPHGELTARVREAEASMRKLAELLERPQ